MILYVNSCVRSESRTNRLAKVLLAKMGEYTELYLPDANIRPLSEKMLQKRTALLASGNFDDPMFDYAKQLSMQIKLSFQHPFGMVRFRLA